MTARATPEARRLGAAARATGAIAWAVVTAVTAGCGIPLDDAPRDIAASTTTVPGQRGSNDTGSNPVYLYYITDGLVTPVGADVASRAPSDVLTALLAGPAASPGSTIATQIPAGTRLLGATLDGQVLTVDVSSNFGNLVGTGRTQATAQIVLTATALEDAVGSVMMRVDGSPTKIFSPEQGDIDRVNACDYVSLLPTDDQLRPMSLDPGPIREVRSRRSKLVEQCPASGAG